VRRHFLFLTLLFIPLSLFSEGNSQIQLLSRNPNESYISIEAGNYLGVSFSSNKIDFDIGYIYLEPNNFLLASDIYIINFNFLNNLWLKSGIGGELLFNSTIEKGLESYIFLRFPMKLGFKNIYLKLVPMVGASMFEEITNYYLNFNISLGYRFDLVRERKLETSVK